WQTESQFRGKIKKTIGQPNTKTCSTCINLGRTADPSHVALSYNYGIDLEQFTKLLNQQAGRCLICRYEHQKTSGRSKDGLVVDHDHVSNKVRGLLCHTCNVGLGMFRDDANLLEAAKRYLHERKSPPPSIEPPQSTTI